jgi:hypothetical protein
LELLKKQIFNEITVDRFVEILRLEAPGGPSFMPMTEAIEGCSGLHAGRLEPEADGDAVADLARVLRAVQQDVRRLSDLLEQGAALDEPGDAR